MALDSRAVSADDPRASGEVAIIAWLRWWHWLILLGLLLGGMAYLPLWRFERRWNQVQVGDSIERVRELVGDPGAANYTAAGVAQAGPYESYSYRVYGRSYEVQVSMVTRKVIAKNVGAAIASSPNAAPPTPRGSTRAKTKR